MYFADLQIDGMKPVVLTSHAFGYIKKGERINKVSYRLYYRRFAHIHVCDRVVRGPEGTPIPVRPSVRTKSCYLAHLPPTTA